jgi:molybdate transport system substrate-binding protein
MPQKSRHGSGGIVVLIISLLWGIDSWAEPLVIAASPSMKAPVEALARAFEAKHPTVQVHVYYDTGLDLRQRIAGMENSPQGYIFGRGPIHVLAPGGDELITRLEQKYYVLPGTRRAYVAIPLALVVPATLVEAPSSFQDLVDSRVKRIAIADPTLTELGRQTIQLFNALGIAEAVKGKSDIASDPKGILDHLLHGDADVGIVFGPDAYQERERVRVVAVSDDQTLDPTVHSMAMERHCPNRSLCAEFLSFIQTSEAHAVVKDLGYVPPRK